MPRRDVPYFRLHGKVFFLTWPQCTTPKEVTLERIRTKWPDCKAIVCEEEHADGSPHLHATILFDTQTTVNGLPALNGLASKQGNYKISRSAFNSVRYTSKVSGQSCARMFSNILTRRETSVPLDLERSVLGSLIMAPSGKAGQATKLRFLFPQRSRLRRHIPLIPGII